MAMFTIYGIPGSPFMRAVVAALVEKGQPWRVVPLAPGASKQPEHLARHPFGRIPAVEHDGFALYETQAVLRYIDQVFPEPALTPRDARAAARMNQAIGINDWYLFKSVGAGIVFNRLIAPMFGMPSSEEAVVAALPDARLCVRTLDEMLGDKPFLAGDAISLADLHIGPHLDMLSDCPKEGAELLGPTRLPAWLARLRERPSFQRTTMQQIAANAA